MQWLPSPQSLTSERVFSCSSFVGLTSKSSILTEIHSLRDEGSESLLLDNG